MTKKIEGNADGLAAKKNLTTVIYALQAASFVLGVTYFVAVILNYAKYKDVKGTWLESHFRWQIRTFWFSLLWGVLAAFLLMFLAGYMILIADLLWVVFRITVGWVRLIEGKPIVSWKS